MQAAKPDHEHIDRSKCQLQEKGSTRIGTDAGRPGLKKISRPGLGFVKSYMHMRMKSRRQIWGPTQVFF